MHPPRSGQALWMLLSSLVFAVMGVCIKFASAYFNPLEIVFYRGVVGVVALYGATRFTGVTLRTTVPSMHLWRCAVGVVSLVGWFYAISVLPLATGMTLNYMSSVWIAVFLIGGALLTQASGQPLLRQGPLFVAVLCGFAGVAMMLRPTLQPGQEWGAMAGLASGIFAAMAYLQVSALARAGEPESRTVFYFSLAAVVVGGIGTLALGPSPWSWDGAVWLLPIGVLALFGQLFMTRAYASGATLVVANLQYMGIVFAGLFSLLVFDDQLPLLGWLGMALIIASGIAATVLRSRALPRTPAEDHSA